VASDAVSAGHPPPRRRDTYRPSIHTVCKILHMKMTLKLKINMLWVHLGLNIYLLNPSTGLPNLVRLCL
jgi:hypothetical protein